MNYYRTGWISDVHLGTKGSNAAALLDFLRENDFEKLYIVGDLIDIWALRRGIYWPQEHSDVIQKILRKARKGTRVIYIPGNHDEFLLNHLGAYGAVTIQKHAFHITADGRRIFIMHGHELDTVVQNVKWLALAGDLGYQFLLSLNPLINFVRRRFGFGYWSLSQAAKRRIKDAVSFIGAYEHGIARYAERFNVQGVLCGHIHTPAIRPLGAVTYYNCGDWVENCSAMVEHADGRMELLTNLQLPRLAKTLPCLPTVRHPPSLYDCTTNIEAAERERRCLACEIVSHRAGTVTADATHNRPRLHAATGCGSRRRRRLGEALRQQSGAGEIADPQSRRYGYARAQGRCESAKGPP